MTVNVTYLSTEMQQRCKMLAVEKYTSRLLYTLQIHKPNNHFPVNIADALNVIAQNATSISAIANDTTK